MMLQLFDRIPGFARLPGLLGLVGVPGGFDLERYRFSAPGFLSYLCCFHFFSRFVGPHRGPTAASTPLLLPAVLTTPVSLWLFSVTPLFGFLGFAGYFGSYDSSPSNTNTPLTKERRHSSP